MAQVAPVDVKPDMLIKALVDSFNTLLEDLRKLSESINQAIDMTEFASRMDDIKLFHPILHANLGTAEGGVSRQSKPENGFKVVALFMWQIILIPFSNLYCFMVNYLIAFCYVLEQKANGTLDFQSDGFPHTISEDYLLKIFDFVGDQVFYLWNTFLSFHRFAFTSHHYYLFRHPF